MEITEKDSQEETEFTSYFKEKLGNYFKEYDWEIEKFNNNNRAIYFLENKKNIDDVIFIKQIKLFYEENILKEIKEILKETDINSDKEIEKENRINKDIIKEIKKIYKEKIDQEIQKGNKNINEVIQKEKNIDQVILKIIKEKKIKEMNQNTLKEIYFLVLLRQIKEYYFSKLNEIKIFDDKKYVFLIFRENKISLDMLMETINCQIFENEKSIQNIIFYICLELVYLHFNNIIHNDLKPSNILISNESPLVPLCDFGAMRYEGEISNEYTKYYVAPEFFYNNDKRNNKSDMWSLGIIMIEIFYTKNISEKLSELDKNKLLSNLDKEEKEKELLSKLEKKAKKELFSKIGIREKYDSSKEEIEKNINFEKIKNIVKNEKAFHLIEKLVVSDPDKRYNVKEALKSDYLIDLYDTSQFETDNLARLNTYDKINKLKDEKEVFEIIKELDSKLKEFK
jgi:serine/threonine protein kinase